MKRKYKLQKTIKMICFSMKKRNAGLSMILRYLRINIIRTQQGIKLLRTMMISQSSGVQKLSLMVSMIQTTKRKLSFDYF
jgi:hypothetical protein